MAEVVAQLLAVRERLAAAAVTATRAGAEAEQARRHYSEAARGTDDTAIRAAVTNVGEAADKSAKVARLLETARGHLAVYLNRIAPGSVPDQDAGPSAMPSGDRLVAEAHERSDRRRDIGSFLSRATRNIENLQDAGKDATKAGQDVLKILSRPAKPEGGTPAGTSAPSVVQPEPQPRIDAPEAVGHLVVVGVVAGIAAHRAGQLINKWIARFRERDRKE